MSADADTILLHWTANCRGTVAIFLKEIAAKRQWNENQSSTSQLGAINLFEG
jgi:hypothetical protein